MNVIGHRAAPGGSGSRPGERTGQPPAQGRVGEVVRDQSGRLGRDRPGRMVALEMGGSNPAIVMDDADLRQAVTVRASQRAAWQGPGRCLATGTTATSGRGWVWLEQDSPPGRVLRELR